MVEDVVKEANYDDFLKALPESEPRYAVYDFDYDIPKPDGSRAVGSRVIFYSW